MSERGREMRRLNGIDGWPLTRDVIEPVSDHIVAMLHERRVDGRERPKWDSQSYSGVRHTADQTCPIATMSLSQFKWIPESLEAVPFGDSVDSRQTAAICTWHSPCFPQHSDPRPCRCKPRRQQLSRQEWRTIPTRKGSSMYSLHLNMFRNDLNRT